MSKPKLQIELICAPDEGRIARGLAWILSRMINFVLRRWKWNAEWVKDSGGLIRYRSIIGERRSND